MTSSRPETHKSSSSIASYAEVQDEFSHSSAHPVNSDSVHVSKASKVGGVKDLLGIISFFIRVWDPYFFDSD
jgi:hypothetical protein